MDRSALAERRSSRLKLLGLTALFFGPLLLSWAYQKAGFDWYPAPRLTGVLIQPPMPVPLHAAAPSAAGRWTLVVAGECDQACWKTQIELRQIWLSLPRYQDALVRVYVYPSGQGLAADQLDELRGVVAVEDADGGQGAEMAECEDMWGDARGTVVAPDLGSGAAAVDVVVVGRLKAEMSRRDNEVAGRDVDGIASLVCTHRPTNCSTNSTLLLRASRWTASPSAASPSPASVTT